MDLADFIDKGSVKGPLGPMIDAAITRREALIAARRSLSKPRLHLANFWKRVLPELPPYTQTELITERILHAYNNRNHRMDLLTDRNSLADVLGQQEEGP